MFVGHTGVKYDLNYTEAVEWCQSKCDGQSATYLIVKAAHDKGYGFCRYLWTQDYKVVLPIQPYQSGPNCGNADGHSVHIVYSGPNHLWRTKDAACLAPKGWYYKCIFLGDAKKIMSRLIIR